MLPNINATPSYRLTQPSTGNEVRFRPFLVKEQKNLMIAMESQDDYQIVDAIVNTIKACCEDVDFKKVTTYDLEYMFLQIRGKSIGEKSSVSIACPDCEERVDININLDDIEVDLSNVPDKMIPLNDTYTVEMKHPHYDFLNHAGGDSEVITSPTQLVIQMAVACLDAIHTNDERISFSDYKREDILNFLDSLTADQFALIADYIAAMPKLTHDVTFECTKCDKIHHDKLQGIQSFF